MLANVVETLPKACCEGALSRLSRFSTPSFRAAGVLFPLPKPFNLRLHPRAYVTGLSECIALDAVQRYRSVYHHHDDARLEQAAR